MLAGPCTESRAAAHARRVPGAARGGPHFRSLHTPPVRLVITLAISLFLLLALASTQQGWAAAALKLPSFLTFWQPASGQQQQQSQAKLAALELMSSEASSLANQQAAAAAMVAPARDSSSAARQRGASLKRPFQLPLLAGGVKYPGALFHSLPKSLFGRILSSSPPTAQSAQQHQQQSPATHSMPSSLMLAHEQIMPLIFKHRPHNKPFSTLPSGSALPSQFGMNLHQTRFLLAPQPPPPESAGASQQHAITSFRPLSLGPSGERQQAEAQKHALGYGESHDDFVILNAQQVPELAGLAQQPAAQASRLGPAQADRVAASATRKPSEEYREMPAIVIAEPENDVNGSVAQQLVPSAPLATPSEPKNETTQESTTGERQQESAPGAAEQLKVGPTRNQTEANENAAGAEMQPDLSRPNPEVGALEGAAQKEAASNKTGADEASQLAGVESSGKLNATSDQQQVALGSEPENGRLESSASAVVVSSLSEHGNGRGAQEGALHESLEQPERFILGPFKGGLGPHGLASSPSHFVEPAEQFHQMMAHRNQIQHLQPPQHMNKMIQMAPQQQQQHYQHVIGTNKLLGTAATNLIQQARHLIHLPFSLGQQQHQHQHVQQQQQQQQNLFFPGETLMESPNGELIFAHSDLRPMAPAPYKRAPTRNIAASQLPGHNFVFQQWQQPALQLGQQQPSKQRTHLQAAPHFAHLPASNDYNFLMSAPSGPTRPNNQNAYFMDSVGPQMQQQQQQQQIVFEHNNEQFQRQQPPTLNYQGHKFKSGLYQIEPPRLAANSSSESQRPVGGEADESEQQQQFKIDATQEGLNELNHVDESDDAADNDEGAKESERESQKDVAVAELASSNEGQQERNLPEMSRLSGLANGATAFAGQSSSNSSNFGHRGQVFSEPAAIQKSANEIRPVQPEARMPSQAMGLGLPASGSRPGQLLSTQVYTLPYSVAMLADGQTFHFTPGDSGRAHLQLRPHNTLQAAPSQGARFMGPSHQMQSTAPVANFQTPLTLVSVANYQEPEAPRVQRQHLASGPNYEAPGQWSYSRQESPLARPNVEQRAPMEPPAASYYYSLRDQSQMSEATRQQVFPSEQQQQQQQYFHYQPLSRPELQEQQLAGFQERQQPRYELAPQQQQQQPQQPPPRTEFGEQQHVGALSQQVEAQNQRARESAKQTSESPQVRLEDVSLEPITSDSLLSATSSTPPSAMAVNSRPVGETEDGARQPTEAAVEPVSSHFRASSERQQQGGEQFASGEQQAEVGQRQQAARSPSSFCVGKAAGLYADVEQRCKAYYQCAPTGHQMFSCNNQTQFNQKTQNCDWWYNVDCGGRLGSPRDFASEEAASNKSLVIDTSDSATTQSGVEELQQQQQQQEKPQEQRASQFEVQFSVGQREESSTSANTNGTTLAASELPNMSQIGTTTQEQVAPSTSTVASGAGDEPEQRRAELQRATEASTSTVNTGQQQLFETTPGGGAESEPRVGALPSEVGQPEAGALSEQLNELAAGSRDESAPAGTKSTRRLIQSEFGAASKTARAITQLREKQRALRQQQQQEAREQQVADSLNEPGTAGDSSIFSASAKQAAIDYNPARVGDVLELGRGVQQTTLEGQTGASQTAELSQKQGLLSAPVGATARQGELRNGGAKLERRFGARLAAGRRQA